MVLWDYQRGDRNKIQEWADKADLQKPDRIRLDQKIDSLRSLGFDLALHTNLVAGPLNNSPDKHIYKLRVNGGVAIRIMLCQGPLANEVACTFLVGATERDRQLKPENAPETAAARRKEVAVEAKIYRRLHERFAK